MNRTVKTARQRVATALSLSALVVVVLGTSQALAITQYAWPPPGSPSFVAGGTGAGDASGRSFTFSDWTTSEYIHLYIGTGFFAAGLDGL